MIKSLNDVFDYIEKSYGRKLSEVEKGIIRFRMFVLRESVQIIFKNIGIDASNVEIQ